MGSNGTVNLLDLSFHSILSQVTGIEAEGLLFSVGMVTLSSQR